MNLDYVFLKQILDAMVQNDSHMMSSMQLVGMLDINPDDEAQVDKFIGHIRILNDEAHIACNAQNLGFDEWIDGSVRFDADYRITSRGYAFLDVLNDKKILNKIRKYSVATAFEVGKSTLTNLLSSMLMP